MNQEKFRKMYEEGEVWKDMDEAVAILADTELKTLHQALTTVKSYTGLDMRQDFLLSILNAQVRIMGNNSK